MSDSVSEFWTGIAAIHEEPEPEIARDPIFHPRTADEWQEYLDERIAIGVFERGMAEADAIRCARIMAGSKPGDREQVDMFGRTTVQPRSAARSKRR